MNVLVNWIAEKQANPNSQSNQAIVIYGEKGSGKTLAAKALAKKFPSYRILPGFKNNFNFEALIEGWNVVIVEEPSAENLELLKKCITEKELVVERKGEDAYKCKNTSSFIITSDKPFQGDRYINLTPMEVLHTVVEGI